ncbi:rab11 family-interacting protein 1 isoform X2 [Triplophysa rosa]|uniref:rab11 family-interacting protein 1 isoform X2 n=1 Tax=Triplophysa rosa TaxID=992332 RepID=UPI002545D89E|nr:rab11 family-interacting protein 1 isoform X2 [Triplophysa rosa]
MSLAEQSQQWYPTSVQVTVLQARGLRIKGKNGTNDAYAIMRVAKDKFSTSVAEKSVAPVWKEEASFDLPLFHPSNAERCALQVSVMHRALVGQDKTLGLAVVNLLELYDNKSRNKSEWFKLMGKTGKPDKDRGEVLLDIQFMKNNMTASMFDLSGMDKSRSRLGKLKDKLKGKKKDGMSDSASAIVPSVGQILTDSEGEEEADATPETKKKKSKLKSLFAPKGLHRNISQSMSTLPTLPEKDSAISLSRSSGLNVESPEGKKKFKLFKHKRTDSSDSKVSQGAGSFLGQGTSQSNLCINGSHVYTEDLETRGSRTGSTLSLNSSGHGSMEDLRRGPNRKISTISVDLQTRESPAEEMLKRQEEQRKQEEVRKRLEEERRRQIQEEEREEMRMEEERKRIEREEERKRIEREEEEEEEERRRLEKMEEERRRVEREEERQRREMEEERKRIEREEEEEEMMRLEKLEEEKRRMEREEERKQMEERRRVEEEEMERIEEVARIKREHEEERKAEEERIRAEERTREEEEKRIREEKARLEKERMKKEEETRRIEAEKRRAEEEERLRKEKREAEEREREMAEEKERKERERSRLEKEKMELERKEKMKMEQERKKAEEEEKRKLKAEEEKDEMEKKKKEQMNAIEMRPEVKPRSARMNAGKKAEKADTIGSEYVPSTDPFEESLLLDENSEALSRSSKVSAVKPRPHAVKPLSTIDNQQDFKENQDNITSAKMAEGVQVKMKAPEVKRTGPYAQLTHEELVNLLEKQKDQLSQKDAKIMEMEQYIDNLLVRVMEEQPSILMSLKSMKKAV